MKPLEMLRVRSTPGRFVLAGCNNIACWDGTNWSPIGNGIGDSSGSVKDFVLLPDGTLVIAGYFANGIARWGCASGYANSAEYGPGCYDLTASFYQQFGLGGPTFDLSDSTLRMTPSGGRWAVQWLPGTPSFRTPAGPDLMLGDDAASAPIQLPFTISYPGGATNHIIVGSNGVVGLNPSGWGYDDPSAYAVNLLIAGAKHAPLWSDLAPAAGGGGGTVHVDIDTVTQTTYVTWLNVQEFGSASTTNTFQAALQANGAVEYRYLACGTTGAQNPTLTGFSSGGYSRDPGDRDLSTLQAFVIGPDMFPLAHHSTRPAIGTAVSLTTPGMPAGSLFGVTALGWTSYPSGIELSSIGMPGCHQFVDVASAVMFVPTASTGTFHFTIPNYGALIGAHLYSQALAFVPGINPLGAVSSNGVDLAIGRL